MRCTSVSLSSCRWRPTQPGGSSPWKRRAARLQCGTLMRGGCTVVPTLSRHNAGLMLTQLLRQHTYARRCAKHRFRCYWINTQRRCAQSCCRVSARTATARLYPSAEAEASASNYLPTHHDYDSATQTPSRIPTPIQLHTDYTSLQHKGCLGSLFRCALQCRKGLHLLRRHTDGVCIPRARPFASHLLALALNGACAYTTVSTAHVVPPCATAAGTKGKWSSHGRMLLLLPTCPLGISTSVSVALLQKRFTGSVSTSSGSLRVDPVCKASCQTVWRACLGSFAIKCVFNPAHSRGDNWVTLALLRTAWPYTHQPRAIQCTRETSLLVSLLQAMP